jgi:hypothetical protein
LVTALLPSMMYTCSIKLMSKHLSLRWTAAVTAATTTWSTVSAKNAYIHTEIIQNLNDYQRRPYGTHTRRGNSYTARFGSLQLTPQQQTLLAGSCTRNTPTSQQVAWFSRAYRLKEKMKIERKRGLRKESLENQDYTDPDHYWTNFMDEDLEIRERQKDNTVSDLETIKHMSLKELYYRVKNLGKVDTFPVGSFFTIIYNNDLLKWTVIGSTYRNYANITLNCFNERRTKYAHEIPTTWPDGDLTARDLNEVAVELAMRLTREKSILLAKCKKLKNPQQRNIKAKINEYVRWCRKNPDPQTK